MMTTTQTVVELPLDEQVRMTVEEAGELYNGHFIFFTNSEEIRDFGSVIHYAVPRAISLNKKLFFDSGLSKKYRDRTLYGTPYTCWLYMSEEQMPPILAF